MQPNHCPQAANAALQCDHALHDQLLLVSPTWLAPLTPAEPVSNLSLARAIYTWNAQYGRVFQASGCSLAALGCLCAAEQVCTG